MPWLIRVVVRQLQSIKYNAMMRHYKLWLGDEGTRIIDIDHFGRCQCDKPQQGDNKKGRHGDLTD